MSETAYPQPADVSISASGSTPLWQPLLLRALVTLAFGMVTVFWTTPGVVGLCVCLTSYLLALAGIQYWTIRALGLARGDTRGLPLLGAAGFLAVAAVVVAISASAAVAAWLGGAALAALGAAELIASLRTAKTGRAHALKGDWMISAALGLGTGILLPFFIATGPHGLLGVAGGGAIMSGALWALSALTLRHSGSANKKR
ncbi:hypothetical protein ACFUCV_11100 [Specibacter sp. NPDC057265]|uniref:hypothetical protein n=1 Tax=Specibacter sp. NPDC057265 TaxID=3346075 RepID=UPI00362EC894